MRRGGTWLVVALLSWAAASGEVRGETPQSAAVRVAVSEAAASLAGLRARLDALSWIELVEGPGAADLTLARSPEGFVVRGADGAVLAPPVAAQDRHAGARVAELAIGWAHRVLMGRIASPGSDLDVTFQLEQLGGWAGGGGVRVLEPGEALRWEARNFSQGPVYVHVYAISPDGGVSLVYPLRGRAKAVEPGDAVDQVVEVSLPDGLASVTDLLLLVATDAPFDPAGLLDPARIPASLADLEARRCHTARHELVVRRPEVVQGPEVVATGEVAGVEAGAAGPSPRARRRTPRTLRFDVYYGVPPELGAVQSRLAKVSKLCGRGGSACKVTRSPLGDGVFEVERTGRRLGEGSVQTVASAFEQAYQMRTGLRAARVAPQLGIEPEGGPTVDAPPPLHAGQLAGFRSLYPAARATRAEADYRRLFGGSELEAVAYFETEVLHHHRFDPEVAGAIGAIVAGGADEAAFAKARRALLRRGISGSLRKALEATDASG